ncbi:hypothetical protein RhiJN_20951 [Ceratobasidium sp. AG-Ba]|nr:hypothetical protein RhiJN_20951 [Ceratobasidium sp. AG-Ba]
MPSERLTNLRNRIADDPAISRCGLRSVSPEPTTEKGTRRGHAELDTPPPGEEQSSLIVTGPRSRRPSKNSSYYREERARSRSQKRATSANQDGTGGAESAAELTDGSTSGPRLTRNGAPKVAGRRRATKSGQRLRSTAELNLPGGRTAHRIATNNRVRVRQAVNRQEAEEREQHERAYDLRHRIARSPTPGSTDGGDECDGECGETLEAEQDIDELRSSPPPLPAASGSDSQYTYIYKTAGYETLAAYAEAKYDAAFDGWPERDIYEAMEVMEKDKANQVCPPAPETEVHIVETRPLRVGRGWHRENEPMPGSQLGKRPSEDSIVHSSSKRARGADPNDTATEPESDGDEVMADAPAPPPGPPPPPVPTLPLQNGDSRAAATVLERQDTADTVIETPLEGQPPSSSQSLNGEPSRFSSLPELLPAFKPRLRGPAHARLRRTLEERANANKADRQQDSESDEALDRSHVIPSPPPPPPPSPVDTPTSPTTASRSALSAPRPPRTYAGARTHANEESQPIPNGSEPSPTQRLRSDLRLARRSGSRSVLEYLTEPYERDSHLPTAREMKAARAEMNARTRLFASCARPSALPKDSFSHQPPIQTAPCGRKKSSGGPQASRRLHPVAAARADMAAFDERCARKNGPTFVESVTQQTSRTPRCPAPLLRPLGDLLPDEEEALAQAEAIAAGTQPTGGRKKKPLARDCNGIRRQVLLYAKLHLLAYSLVEGAYQTRISFLLWAGYVHEATWKLMLPHVPYEAATKAELEIMVNYIATLRGKIKDRVRPVIEQYFGFDPHVVTQEDIQRNLDIFHEIYPNSFHCTSTRPRKGHFEGDQLARCIAAALFYGPNSVGVMFPDYFEDMPLTVVAFILAIMQFCIEEWSTGYFVSHDLGASHMLDKYEAHLQNLKELQSVAPRRLERMQAGWTEYAFDYSGASFLQSGKDREQATFHAEMRPDTPPPETPVGSLTPLSLGEGSSTRALAPSSSRVMPSEAEFDVFHVADLDERSCSPNPLFDAPRAPTPYHAASRPSSPPPEYNEYGCRTASSSGKGRAD